MTKDKVLEKVKKVYGDLYDYSLVDEVTKKDPYVRLICPKHGLFLKRFDRIKEGHCGCPKCSGKVKKDLEQFIEEANKVHDNKYSYEKAIYINAHTKLTVTCPIHGDFLVTPTSHISNKIGCQKCSSQKMRERFAFTKEKFIEKAREVHGDAYDYSKVEYVNNTTKVCIICPQHGEFWQMPQNHLKGKGCPKCKSSHLEREVRKILSENGIIFEEQKKFDWLGQQSLDFYIPSSNIGIECQGKQHFGLGGWESSYEEIKERDERKNALCKENNLNLLYYSDLDIEYPYDVIVKKEDLINKICNN